MCGPTDTAFQLCVQQVEGQSMNLDWFSKYTLDTVGADGNGDSVSFAWF